MAGKREQQMKEITERLEQGVKELFTSEMYTEYLKTMSQFHNYSFNNTVLIAMQKPDATLVAGYQAWQKKFKRQVKRGEKGIQIIAPAPIREKEEIEKFDPETNEPILRPDGQPETEVVVHTIPRFRVTTVFDVSQTYGEPLPELETPELMGNVENFENFMQALGEISPVPMRFAEIESGAKGYYSNTDKEIVLQDGMSERQTMKTGIHETTHAKLHDREIMEELGEKKNQMTREVEAESVAYTVCQYFGLDTSDYSFPYIAGWSSSVDMKELKTSMDTIRRTAGEMIDGMTEVMQRLMRETPEKEHPEEKDAAGKDLLPGVETDYQEVELFDVPALFSNGRVDETLLPPGVYRYELRGSDYDPGYPITVEKDVAVNHAATVLSAFPVPLPENGRLWLGYGLNFTGKEQTIREYLQETADREMETEMEKMQNAIGRENEELHLSGREDCYAIYQITGTVKGRDYRFMGLDYVASHGLKVDAADYDYVYGGRLSGEETLDSLYERFNIDHPAGYEGRSLSVSDVVVLQKEGKANAYYVDRLGFTELPDFVQERLHEAEMNRKREHSPVTLDTSGIEIEQHEGLWHSVDKREIGDEIFYLMKHNEYGDSVAAVIVDSEGELAAQELWNGFDRGAMEAVREYLSQKGIVWEPGEQEAEEWGIVPETQKDPVEAEQTPKPYPPVYRHTLTYAVEHAAADEYLDSRKLNMDCKKAVEEAIRTHFDGLHLAEGAVEPVLEAYGQERLAFVLACTVQYKAEDGRFSRETKAWAAGISVPENVSRGMDLNLDYVVDSHPAVLDGFIGSARDRFAELEKEQDAVGHTDFDTVYELPEGQGYFHIQTTAEGWYDYTFYDREYRELDGGVYENPDISIREAAQELLAEEQIELENCPVTALDEFMDKAEEAGEREREYRAEEFSEEGREKIPLTSGAVQPEKALGGMSRSEIEETVLCYAQAQLEDMGLADEVKLNAARVYGSRTREGLYNDGSDVDVVLFYTGNIREDDFFSALHEEGMAVAGLPLDINPISTEKTGTLQEYLEQAEKYLDGKEIQKLTSDIVKFELEYEKDRDMLEFWDGKAEIETEPICQVYEIIGNAVERKDTGRFQTHLEQVIGEHKADEPITEVAADLLGKLTGKLVVIQKEPKISFYAAECMEFPIFGEYHDNLTLEEAVQKYEEIPADRINGVKGIGFRLEDGSMYGGDYELMSAGVISKELIDLVPHYKGSPLVQQAVADLEKILSDRREEKAAEQPQEKQPQKEPEQAQEPAISADREKTASAPEKVLEQGKQPETIPGKDASVSEGTGRKQSVLQALRERQARLKQEQKHTEQKAQNHKKGEQEL